MFGNVPADWNRYFHKCDLCNESYHASEGGCNCTEDLECGGGEKCSTEWGMPFHGEGYEDLRCIRCGTGPKVETRRFVKIHTARKMHGKPGYPGAIMPGERYRAITILGYHPDGPRYMERRKEKIKV